MNEQKQVNVDWSKKVQSSVNPIVQFSDPDLVVWGKKLQKTPGLKGVKTSFPNMATSHKEDCACGYCKPVDLLDAGVIPDDLDKEPVIVGLSKDHQKAVEREWKNNSKPTIDCCPVTKEQIESLRNELDNPCLKREPENVYDRDAMREYFENEYGFTKLKKMKGEKKAVLKGALIFHVDVGQLPVFKAEAHIEKVKETMNELVEGAKPHWVSVFIPTRIGETHIEQLIL